MAANGFDYVIDPRWRIDIAARPIRAHPLTGEQHLVYSCLLAGRCPITGRCLAWGEEIEAETGLSRDAIKRAVSFLGSIGLVRRRLSRPAVHRSSVWGIPHRFPAVFLSWEAS